MVKPDKSRPSIRRQCELLRVSRSSVYYEPVSTNEEQLSLMRRIDELHLDKPFYGSRLMTQMLKKEGRDVNRKTLQRLMRLMDIESVAPKPNTTRPSAEHPKYPYLLRNLKIYKPNQVWAADITYVPLAKGFAYLVAIMDLFSRLVLSWRVIDDQERAVRKTSATSAIIFECPWLWPIARRVTIKVRFNTPTLPFDIFGKSVQPVSISAWRTKPARVS